jgi:hypothetical protein
MQTSVVLNKLFMTHSMVHSTGTVKEPLNLVSHIHYNSPFWITEEHLQMLMYIFNKSLSQGIFFDRLKYVRVIPLFKKRDRNLLPNYRLISPLTGFSKLFEILIFWRLDHQFQDYQILVPQKYGLQWGISTDNDSFKLILSSMHGIRKCIWCFSGIWQGHLTTYIPKFCCTHWNVMISIVKPQTGLNFTE